MVNADFLCMERNNRKGIYYYMPLTGDGCTGQVTNHKFDFQMIKGKKRGYGWYIQREWKGKWKH